MQAGGCQPGPGPTAARCQIPVQHQGLPAPRRDRGDPPACPSGGALHSHSQKRQGLPVHCGAAGTEKLKERVWDGIGRTDRTPAWVKRFRNFHEDRRAGSASDYLFRNAPVVLFIAAHRTDDAGLGAQNMNPEAVALGLGMLCNGYLRQAAAENPEVRQGIGAGEKPLALCALRGYPAAAYLRTAPPPGRGLHFEIAAREAFRLRLVREGGIDPPRTHPGGFPPTPHYARSSISYRTPAAASFRRLRAVFCLSSDRPWPSS